MSEVKKDATKKVDNAQKEAQPSKEPKINLTLNLPQAYKIHTAVTCKMGVIQTRLAVSTSPQESAVLTQELNFYASFMQEFQKLENECLKQIKARETKMVVCPKCKQPNAPTAKFCQKCGAPLVKPEPAKKEEVAPKNPQA